MSLRVIAALLAFLVSSTLAFAAPAETILGEWTDTARAGRVVPYKIYIAPAAQPQPVVVFSHGLGGSRDGAEYLLRFIAENGYVAVAVQHPGSDTPAVFGAAMENGDFDRAKLEDAIQKAITPAVAVDRFRDIPFAVDQLDAMNKSDATLRGRLNMSRIGMSGHSYGALTTLILSGQTTGGGRMTFSFADPRITASIAYSPSKPRQGDPTQAFASIHIPTFHMTGTDDMNPLDASEPASNRQFPYRNITGADKYLIVFNGGDHMIFSGRRIAEQDRPNDDMFHALIQKASLAYWDAYLKENAQAKAYLTQGGFAKDLGANGAFEFQLR